MLWSCLEGADGIVLSIISLIPNTCSIVDLFLRYAAWDMGIAGLLLN